MTHAATLASAAAGAVGVWLVLLTVLAAATRAREPEPGPATMELAGDEPPAVVNARLKAVAACLSRSGAPEDSPIVFIGEGPGENEDLQGRPFVGRAGEMLNKWIAAMGLRREDVYIANIVKCRPPGNRVPMPDEVATCTPYLERQIEIIRPRVIVTLGRPAATLFGGWMVMVSRHADSGHRAGPGWRPIDG